MSGTGDMTGKSPSTRCRPIFGRFRAKFLLPSNPTPKNDGSRRTRPVHTACRKSCRSETSSGRESRKGPPAKAAGSRAVDRCKAPLRSWGGAGSAYPPSRRGQPARSRRLAHHPYQLHRVDPAIPIEQTMRVLRALRNEGRIRHIGLSEIGIEEIERARSVVEIATVKPAFEGFFVSRDRA